MSRTLSALLGIDDPMFAIGMEQLERASGRPGVDVRLTADVIASAYQKMRELGLDPRDTTGPELYQGLMNLIRKHDAFLAAHIGVKDSSDVGEVLDHIRNMFDRMKIPKTAWVLKSSAAKRLLKATPPKKVMKHLGYRSIESMLKREPIAELFAGVRILETKDWQHNFLKKYSKLKAGDFEPRHIEVLCLDRERWSGVGNAFMRQKRHNIVHLKELGVVAMLPMPMQYLRGISIAVLPLVLHYINEIRTYSAYFKLQQVRADFGTVLSHTLITDPGDHAIVAAKEIHWRMIHRYFGKKKGDYPEFFEPHVSPEDLEWRKAEEILYRLEPALHFWHDMDYVGMLTREGVVSFSLMDLAISYVNNLPYEARSMYHMRLSLDNEIMLRYLAEPAMEQHILRQLNTQAIDPGLLVLSQKLRGSV